MVWRCGTANERYPIKMYQVRQWGSKCGMGYSGHAEREMKGGMWPESKPKTKYNS
jgi:hypothetical protein